MAAHGGTRHSGVPGSGHGSGESWRKGMAATGLSGLANGPKGQAAWSARWQFQGKIKSGWIQWWAAETIFWNLDKAFGLKKSKIQILSNWIWYGANLDKFK
jgi:hypothetical protein